MNESHPKLPPALGEALNQLLRRYRRFRALHALLRTLLWSFVPTLMFLLLWASDVSVGTPWLWGGWVLTVLLIAGGIVVPLLRNPLRLETVAAQVDRCHPELKDRLVSAVALSEGAPAASDWMLSSFFSDTQSVVTSTPLFDGGEARDLRRVGFLTGCCLLIYLLSLGGVWRLGIFWHPDGQRDSQTMAVADLSVKPGDITIAPGERVVVWVSHGDTVSAGRIYWGSEASEDKAMLTRSTTAELSHHTFPSISESMSYRVEVGGQASPRYAITVHTPPAVASIELYYEFPGYLGRPPERVPYGGNITAVEGTMLTLTAYANGPMRAATMVLNSGDDIPLVGGEDGRSWSTTMTLSTSDRYHIALEDSQGAENAYPDDYTLTVNPDVPPVIQVQQPRGDREVLALEEVAFAFAVKDDYGVADYGLEYTVAGQPPVRIPLGGTEGALREFAGEHLLALEALGVTPGDLITWTVWADDRKPDRRPYEIMSDPFFLEVRPYTKRFREQISQGGEGQSGPSIDQRQIIISLWNLRKAIPTLEEAAFEDGKEKIAEAQESLLSTAQQGLAMGRDDTQILEAAVVAMTAVLTELDKAELPDPDLALSQAISHAQQAFHHLMRLEPDERQVARSGEGGGSGGAASEAIQALELSKRKDYQEEARTGAEDVEKSEALRNALEELTRRQQILNEDVSKTVSEEEGLTEEEKKRRLERLEKEQARQLEALDALQNEVAASKLDEEQRAAAAQNLQQARAGMESSLESVRREELQQAGAAGRRAEKALSATEESLSQLTQKEARSQFEELKEQLDALAAQHKALEGRRDTLREEQSTPGISDADEANEAMTSYTREKALLAQDTKDFLQEAGTLSDRTRKEQGHFSRKLGDWVRETSQAGVVDDMMEGPQYAQYGMWDAAGMADAKVREKLADAATGLTALSDEWIEDEVDGMRRALDQLAALEAGLAQDTLDAPSEDTTMAPPSSDSAATENLSAGKASSTADPEPSDPAAGAPSQGTPSESPSDDIPQDSGAEAERPGGTASGASSGGSASGDAHGGMAEALEGRGWRTTVQESAALLPRDSASRAAVEQLGLQLGQLQRSYDATRQLPPSSEFEQVVQRPLREAIAQLEAELERALEGTTEGLEDEGAVPDRYVDRVSEYFRVLAEEGENAP